jgi:hypothetical protein
MTGGRGRRVAVGAGVLGLLVLAGTAFALRDRLIEQWHLFRLESRDVSVRFRAAVRLGEMRSLRALPKLVDVLKETDERRLEAEAVWGPRFSAEASGVAGVFAPFGSAAVPALDRALDETSGEKGHYWRRTACLALAGTKAPEAVAPLVERVSDADACVRLFAIKALGSMGPIAKDARSALRETFRERKSPYASLAEEALEKIDGASGVDGTAEDHGTAEHSGAAQGHGAAEIAAPR